MESPLAIIDPVSGGSGIGVGRAGPWRQRLPDDQQSAGDHKDGPKRMQVKSVYVEFIQLQQDAGQDHEHSPYRAVGTETVLKEPAQADPNQEQRPQTEDLVG